MKLIELTCDNGCDENVCYCEKLWKLFDNGTEDEKKFAWKILRAVGAKRTIKHHTGICIDESAERTG